MKRNTYRRVISLILSVALCIIIIPSNPIKRVEAATTNISVGYFSKLLGKEIGITAKDNTNISYVNALMEKGIIKEGDFLSYTDWLTRGDAMLLLNRADEYLYGDNLDPELVQTAIDKRISDISKVKENKRADVVKAYLKGYVKGYSNGEYSTDRLMKVEDKISKSAALGYLKMIKKKSLRSKISPDGQLIRTTNLPKSADKYPYILASYPNEYYDWEFLYQGATRTRYNPVAGRMEDVPYVYLEEYSSPVDIDKMTRIENFSEVKNEMLDIWVNKVRVHMENIFNVDYRTINQDWIDTVAAANYTYGYWGMEDQTRARLEKYIVKMKKNMTKIESSKISVDGSSLYYFNGDYYLRVYVRYRINSSKDIYKSKEFYEEIDNNLIYTSYPISFNDFELGEWKECCFDVALTNYKIEDRKNIGIFRAIIAEKFYTDRKIK